MRDPGNEVASRSYWCLISTNVAMLVSETNPVGVKLLS